MRERDLHTGPRGLRLRLCTWGPEQGPAAVILHGYLEQAAAWDGVAQRLGGRVVAPDHRGHGLSEHIGPGGWYHFWDYVPDCDAVLDFAGPPVDLIGHSMGGTLATLLAATRPEKVRRLVLIEGLGQPDMRHEAAERPVRFLDARTRPPKHGTLASPEADAARMRKYNPNIPEETALMLARRTTRPVVTGDPDVEAPTPGTFTWTWDPLHRGRNPTPFSAEAHRGFLERLTCPVLVITGGTSPFHLPDFEDRVAAIPNVEVAVLPDAGHLCHHDNPDGLVALLRRFLA